MSYTYNCSADSIMLNPGQAFNMSTITLASLATIATIARPSYTCCTSQSKTGSPDWFIDAFLLPWEKTKCETPFPFYLNDTIYVFIDKYTGSPTDYRKICTKNIELSWRALLAYHYITFWDMPASPVINPTNLWQAKFLQTALYCTPIALFMSLFGLHIIRKVLTETESMQLFVYHTVLVCSDMLLYLFAVLNGTFLASAIGFLGCMASPMLAVYQPGYGGVVAAALLVSLYCFVNLVQAVLAADRLFAVFAPVGYRARASAKLSALTIGGVFTLNLLLTLFELTVLDYHWAALTNQASVATPSVRATAPPLMKVGAITRITLFVAAISTQALCCAATFVKIRRKKLHPVAGAGGVSPISLVPCYLLLGTCALNSIGGVIEIVLFYVSKVNADNQLSNILGSVHFVTVPLCNSCGMYLHCIASSTYRAEVRKLLAPFGRWLGKLLPLSYHQWFSHKPEPASAQIAMPQSHRSLVAGCSAISSGFRSNKAALSPQVKFSVAVDEHCMPGQVPN